MPVLIFIAAFLGAYFAVSVIKAVLRGIAWLLGYAWGFTDAILKGHPGRAFLAFAGLLAVIICVQQF